MTGTPPHTAHRLLDSVRTAHGTDKTTTPTEQKRNTCKQEIQTTHTQTKSSSHKHTRIPTHPNINTHAWCRAPTVRRIIRRSHHEDHAYNPLNHKPRVVVVRAWHGVAGYGYGVAVHWICGDGTRQQAHAAPRRRQAVTRTSTRTHTKSTRTHTKSTRTHTKQISKLNTREQEPQ